MRAGYLSFTSESPMAPSLRYSVFVVASRDGVVVVGIGGKDCISLFHAKKLAE